MEFINETKFTKCAKIRAIHFQDLFKNKIRFALGIGKKVKHVIT